MSAHPQTAVVKPSLSRHVTAVLGPTNTGKTHLAIERMLAHESGLIGLPLRLLAREIYDKIVARIGERDVALITGEEKIKPERARYYVCTVEAMPRDVEVDFLAVDEIQLAADPDRGHVFTDRLLHTRGMSETLLLGAHTMAEPIRELIPGANFITRPRLSKLTYAGQKKITRLPSRSAIVAFSANDVYSIAELIRRQRGGAAVVLGALSPRTRNAQVALYQNGDVDFLIATDAVGMGLNLNVDHVAFAGSRKFDGRNHRNLTAAELGQIAGRAGRHVNDGTFGVTGDVEAFDQDLVNKLENHDFEPVKVLQWRNANLDFDSVDRLKDSLRQIPSHGRLVRARTADDLEALELAANDPRVASIAVAPAAVKRLWEVCQVPDYRKVSPASHGELVATLYQHIMSDEGVIPEDWIAAQVEQADRTDGDIDTLSNRIAHIRTWTFVSNRSEWLKDPAQWQGRTREIEDRLSDALHEQLTQRFVDKRTSALMKAQDRDSFFAEIEKDGRVIVERHPVGKLEGFRFKPEFESAGIHGKAARNAAAKVLVHELAARADRLAASPDTAFTLTREGQVIWEGQEIGRITASEDPLKPTFNLHSDEHLASADKDNITKRIETWLTHHIEVRLKPLIEISKAEDVTGLAKGIAFRLREGFGVLKRETVAEEIKSLDQESRSQLRKYGVRFGAYNIYFPLLLKPASSDLLLLLWLLKHSAEHNLTPAAINESPRQGLTSVPRQANLPEAFYRATGFQVCGNRAVRIDMLERLADLIRPLTSWKPTEAQPEPPTGAVGNGAFKIKPEMMSIMGCSSEELGQILESLSFRREKRLLPKQPSPVLHATAPALSATDQDGIKVANDNVAQEQTSDNATIIDASERAIVAEQLTQPEIPPSEAQAVQALSTADAALEASEPEQTSGTQPQNTAEPEPEYEEIWRFRRPKPKTERTERPFNTARAPGKNANDRPERSNSRPYQDRHRQGGSRPFHKPVGEGEPEHSSSSPSDAAPQSKGPYRHQRHNQANSGDRRRDGSDHDKNRYRAAPPNDAVKTDSESHAPASRSTSADQQQRDLGRFIKNKDRFDRGKSNSIRPHSGRSFAASASPKKTSSVDPDSPFAALSQLKERLEKQSSKQDEAI